MKKYVMGLDNGGTTTKAALFDIKGKEIQSASRHTPVITPKPGYVERDMERLWNYNCACIREVVEKARINVHEIIGIAVCGHGKGIYPWGKDNKPAYNGIVSTDGRAWRYPPKWKEAGILRKYHPRLCQEIMACQQVSLLAWLKEHRPDVYDNIKWVFSVKDYIRFRLTNEAFCEITDISGSGLMDVKNARFDKKMLEEFGIGEVFEKLAPIRYSYEQCGRLTKESSRSTGLPEGIPVAGGMFDIDACAIAMDMTSTKEICTIAGTWSINEYIAKEPVMDGSIAMNSLYAIPGFYLVEECSATSAGNLEWYLKNCMENEVIPERENIYGLVNSLVEGVKPEDCDVYFLPFLYGSNTHPLGKAAFVGLTAYHTKAHMLRAIFEGVAYSHKTHIEKLLMSRKKTESIRMAGGAVNSKVWVQMFADILNMPVEVVRAKELGAMGAAMAAAVAAGEYRDYGEAAKGMVRIAEVIRPDPETAAIYREKYEKYREVCHALDTVWNKFVV